MGTMDRLVENGARHQLRQVDDRFGSAGFLHKTFNKVFPDHWSFLLGEIALYSFIILVATGVFLSFFYHASGQEVVYHGSYTNLRGLTMTESYASTLHISFDVRGGLLMRQIHHWAALLFVASMVVHSMRIFFTGAYRKPREMNWMIGTTLLILGIFEGFAGYSLPDDLISGTGIRIAEGALESIPVIGTWTAYILFGGDYPASASFLPRLFIAHVLLIPGIILALVSAHMMILWHQKHTDFPGVGKTEHTIVGTRFFPEYVLKGGGFFFLCFGVMAALGAFAQINPIWLYGPYSPAQISAGSQPDWYMGFLDGALRMMPRWQWVIGGHYTIPFNVLIPFAILPGVLFTLMIAWPFLEQRITGDKSVHQLLQRPRDNPWRTAIGAMSLTFYIVLLLGSSSDIQAITFDWSVQSVIWVDRILLVVAPPIAYYFTKRICLGLQQKDRERVEHGIETGVIMRTETGEYYEPERPMKPDQRAVLASQLGMDLSELPEIEGDGHGDGHGNGHRPGAPAALIPGKHDSDSE